MRNQTGVGQNKSEGTNRIIVGRSRLRPHPWTRTSLGKPIGSSISGRNIPLFPTSTHLFKSGWKANISNDGWGEGVMSIHDPSKATHLSIRIIGWFEAHLLDPHLFKENLHETFTELR